MNRRDIVIGLGILLVVAGIIYFVRRPSNTPLEIPEQTVEQKMEDKFKTQIPEGVDKAELTDVTGGDASGIATRDYTDGKFNHAVLADLPDPVSGFYEGWLVRGQEGESDFNFISTGKLRMAKGGYMLDFSSDKDLSDYSKVVITHETLFDSTPEDHILEGSF